MKYEEMLNRAIARIPKKLVSNERFEIPKVNGHFEGNKTVITNFLQIANTLNRKPEHILKFLQRELATPGEIKNKFLYLGSRIPSQRINEKIEEYCKRFVICSECKRPDTKLVKERGVLTLVCHACGARRTVKDI